MPTVVTIACFWAQLAVHWFQLAVHWFSWGIAMRQRIHSEKHATRGARIIFMLTSFSPFFFGFEADGAATPVPRQLYGKSVSVSWTLTSAQLNETTGRFINSRSEVTKTFYFSSL